MGHGPSSMHSRRMGGKACIRFTTLKRILGGAMPVVPTVPGRMLDWLAAWFTALVGRANTRVLRRCSSGNVPQGGGFSRMLFCGAAQLPKAVEWFPVPSLRQLACVVSGEHGRVFPPGPLPVHLDTLQLSRDCSGILCRRAHSGNARAQAAIAYPRSLRGVACGGLKPSIVNLPKAVANNCMNR